MNVEPINVNNIEYIEKFKFIFNNINIMVRLQGLGNVDQEKIIYLKRANKLLWRNIVISVNEDNFDVNVNRGLSSNYYNYNNSVEKFINNMPENLNYVRIFDFDGCIILKDINYSDMDLISKLIAKCV